MYWQDNCVSGGYKHTDRTTAWVAVTSILTEQLRGWRLQTYWQDNVWVAVTSVLTGQLCGWRLQTYWQDSCVSGGYKHTERTAVWMAVTSILTGQLCEWRLQACWQEILVGGGCKCTDKRTMWVVLLTYWQDSSVGNDDRCTYICVDDGYCVLTGQLGWW
jgi:hypothetical protein